MTAHERRSAHGIGGGGGGARAGGGGRGGGGGGGAGWRGGGRGGGRCVLRVDEAGRAELERLSRSAVRGEADRARAVLWSLRRETSAAIAARLGVRAEQVRRWRVAVRSGGVAALRSRPRPGRTPRKREAALAVARGVLGGPIADRPVWTLAGWRGRSRRAPARRSRRAT